MSVRGILGRLTEATFNIRKDVDVIYGRSGLYRLGMAQKEGKAALIEAAEWWTPEKVQWDGSSGDLASEESRQADAVNRVKILVGVTRQGSFYQPERSTISISANDNVIRIFQNYGYKPDEKTIAEIDAFVGKKKEIFWSELSEANLRGTIAHELTHWIDDSLHNRYIGKKLKRVRELGTNARTWYDKVTKDPMELNAQVHAVKEIRDKMGDTFDELTWKELLRRKTSLISNLAEVGSEKEYQDVMRRFVQRLNREGLLGAGLRRLPTLAQMLSYSGKV
jgi:hypothetical protein